MENAQCLEDFYEHLAIYEKHTEVIALEFYLSQISN